MRYLAIDYGTKRTGLAVCDPSETIVSPLTVIEGRKNLVEKILEIIASENIEAIVFGLPLNMDGTTGPQAKKTEQFAEELKKQTSVPVYFQDERLSSFVAEEKLAPAEFTRKKKAKRLDAIAAAQILEAFLEQKRAK
jgi:putative Holliday junction resolvase